MTISLQYRNPAQGRAHFRNHFASQRRQTKNMAGLKFYLDLAQISQSDADGPVEPNVHSGPEPKMPKSLASIGCPLLAHRRHAEDAGECPFKRE
jgi:hypothetical protein